MNLSRAQISRMDEHLRGLLSIIYLLFYCLLRIKTEARVGCKQRQYDIVEMEIQLGDGK